ncbi:MAG: hypothetical protein ACOYW7_11195 [Nitrospirota bacterium]
MQSIMQLGMGDPTPLIGMTTEATELFNKLSAGANEASVVNDINNAPSILTKGAEIVQDNPQDQQQDNYTSSSLSPRPF